MSKYTLNPYTPFNRQQAFLECPLYEVLFGGAAGGGKSIALLAEAVRWIGHPQYYGLILRRRRTDLKHLINKSHEMYLGVDPGAKFNRQEFVWRFRTGAQIQLGYLDSPDDYWQYHGNEYQVVCWDELTTWPPGPGGGPPDAYIRMRSRMRAPGGFMSCYVRATTNPGGVGHSWVKKRFIDPAPPETPIRDVKTGRIRMFIPSKLEDNPALYEDGEYAANLEELKLTSPAQYRAQRHGDWNIAEGAVFPYLDPAIHFVNPKAIVIEPNQLRWRSCDWGFASKGCCLWHTKDPDDNVVTYRELVFRNKTPEQVAEDILRVERDAGERDLRGLLDPACWSRQTGPSVAERFWREGVKWFAANNDRYNGIMEVHSRLQRVIEYPMPDGKPISIPAWRISKACTYLCDTLPVLPAKTSTSRDGRNYEDVDTTADDHGYDAARYGLMHVPLPATDAYGQGGGGRRSDPRERVWRDMDAVTGYG